MMAIDTTKVIQNADRFLSHYHNFVKLAGLSEKPFSKHGEKLVKEIDNTINNADGLSHAFLVNQYQRKGKDKKSRKVFCDEQRITVDHYIAVREKALLEFAKQYLDGALMNQIS